MGQQQTPPILSACLFFSRGGDTHTVARKESLNHETCCMTFVQVANNDAWQERPRSLPGGLVVSCDACSVSEGHEISASEISETKTASSFI